MSTLGLTPFAKKVLLCENLYLKIALDTEAAKEDNVEETETVVTPVIPTVASISNSTYEKDAKVLKPPPEKKKRRMWVREINLERASEGDFQQFQSLLSSPARFFDYLRVTTETFNFIRDRIKHRIVKLETNLRQPISAEERLMVTFRYLATGSSFRNLAENFRIGISTIRNIVRETCCAIWDELWTEFIPPTNQRKFLQISEEFLDQYDFPNCIGNIGSVPICLHHPDVGSSLKNKVFIILHAITDANSWLMAVDVSTHGKLYACNSFKDSELCKLMLSPSFDYPSNRALPGSEAPALPFVILGDNNYPLSVNLMRPFSIKRKTEKECKNEQIFNDRLEKAREPVLTLFDVMFARWPLLSQSIRTNCDTAAIILKAVCILTNVATKIEGLKPDNLKIDESLTRKQIIPKGVKNNTYSKLAKVYRDEFSHYFMKKEGSVD